MKLRGLGEHILDRKKGRAAIRTDRPPGAAEPAYKKRGESHIVAHTNTDSDPFSDFLEGVNITAP